MAWTAMALTLHDRRAARAAVVEARDRANGAIRDELPAVAYPARWQRFGGGRRLAYVSNRRRAARAAAGIIGSTVLGLAIMVGDVRDVETAWPIARSAMVDVAHDAFAVASAGARGAVAWWAGAVAWARLDVPERRLAPATPDARATATTPVAGTGTGLVPDATSPVVAPRTPSTPGVPTALSAPPLTGNVPPGQAVVAQAAQAAARTPIAIVTSTPAPMPTTAAARLPATPAAAARPSSHQVVAGDTLWGIALRYGTSVDAIVKANRLTDADAISPGARLVIPR